MPLGVAFLYAPHHLERKTASMTTANSVIRRRFQQSPWRKNAPLLSLACFLLLGLGGGAFAQDAPESATLIEMSLEELMNIEVTSVSKKGEKRQNAPAAITVLTQDDIRRSGATSLPELLRLVPGVQVARLDASRWSVTARGFGGRYANKLQVLVDGVSIYSPLFSGVYWEAEDILLDDIERVEVIRGPESTLWGANAVNGVINVITKSAYDTTGGRVSVLGGTEERARLSLRYGNMTNGPGAYRLYSQFYERDEGATPSGGEAHDSWRKYTLGGRFDRTLGPDEDLTLVAKVTTYNQESTEVAYSLRPPYARDDVTESDYILSTLMSQWTIRPSDGSELQVKAYWQHWQDHSIEVHDRRDIVDLDFQHYFETGTRHTIVWGAGLRLINDDINEGQFRFDPGSRWDFLLSAFINDEIALVPDTLTLTLGTKVEFNSYSGFEFQPGARLAWTPNDVHTLWMALTRSVRSPSRTEHDAVLPSMTLPRTKVILVGDDAFDSEQQYSFEVGYRAVPHEEISFDLATFANWYDDLRTIELQWPRLRLSSLPVHLELPFHSDNNAEARTLGVEASFDWHYKPWGRLRGAYSYLDIDLRLHPETIDIITAASERDTPRHQAWLWSSFSPAKSVDLDLIMRYVDELPSIDIDDYWTLDLRAAWRPRENLEIALVGQNLLDSQHQEFAPTFVSIVPSELQRGVYAEVSWEF